MRDEVEEILRVYAEDAIAMRGRLSNTESPIRFKDGLGYNPDDKGIVMHPYPRKRAQEPEFRRQFSNMWDSDVIEESDGPHCISYFGRPKKTGDVRICFDFRLLNRVTAKMLYEMPRVDELCEKFKNKRFISTLDMKGGYWHIPIKPEHRHRTAFLYDGQLYQWKRLPFGLMNAGMFFQKQMDKLFEDFVREGFVLVYIDDISIISETREEHVHHLDLVLRRIAEAGVKLRIDKCAFAMKRTTYLGFEVDADGIYATEKYKDKVLNVPKPQNKADIRVFVGMAQFLHKFLPQLAVDVAALTHLTKKNVKWRWTETENSAFESIRTKVREIEALAHPDFSKPFHIMCDASSLGLGGALCQKVDGELVPIYHCSRLFTQTQQNWHVSEQELFSCIYCIEKWRPLLAHQRFHVHTGHKNLIALLNRAENFRTGKLYRWCQRIQDLDFDCHFVAGSANRFADYLSRNGLFVERVPSDGHSDKLANRDIGTAYQLVLAAESLGLDHARRDQWIQRWSEQPQRVDADRAEAQAADNAQCSPRTTRTRWCSAHRRVSRKAVAAAAAAAAPCAAAGDRRSAR